MNDFEYDVMQKKRIAGMAKYRKCGSKSKKCSLSTDNMSRGQWEKRCGEVYTYKMNEPKSWEQFKGMPRDIQKDYLVYLMQKYNANTIALAGMFGVCPLTVRNYIKNNQLGISLKGARGMTEEQKVQWDSFLNGGSHSDEDTNDIVQQEERDGNLSLVEAPVNDAATALKHFSLTFEGEIDAYRIANSITLITGGNAVGKVEIVCTM